MIKELSIIGEDVKKAYCLLNHSLTDNQIKELVEEYNISEIKYPDAELSVKWMQIPASKNLDMNVIKAVLVWIQDAEKDDVLIVQGEFGSTFYIVDYALKNGLIPVYAVTKRIAEEKRNGEEVVRQYIFRHCCFREYKYFSEYDYW